MSSLLRPGFRAAGPFLAVTLICTGLLRCEAQAPATMTATSTPPSAADIQSLSKKLDSLQAEVAEIKGMLQSQAATLPIGATRSPAPIVKVSQNMVLPFVPEQSMGSNDAPFVLVEFGDLQCPFCNDFAKHTLPSFIESHVKSGRVRLLSAEFPLDSHPNSSKLSLANICASEQGKYFEMRDALMNANAESVDAAINGATANLALNKTKMSNCMSSKSVLNNLSQDIVRAKEAGVTSTPAFLVGKVTNGSVTGITFVGDLPPKEFSEQVETAIKKLSEVEHGPEK